MYHPFVKDCPKPASFNGHPVCGCGPLPTNLRTPTVSTDAAGYPVKRGDEVVFEDGRVARILKVAPTGLDVVYRKACDVHPGFHTYYRLSWWWHHLWRHFIGFRGAP